uniref:MucR family transcriptional regulator n=1 Tax=Methylobacterium nigriterrae TaxID=3127512 RepID=UPI0030136F33
MEPENASLQPHIDFIAQAADIVSAYVSRNHVAPAELPALIQAVHTSLAGLANETAQAATAEEQ